MADLTKRQLQQREWYLKNKEKTIARANEWRKEHPERFSASVAKYKKKNPRHKQESNWNKRGIKFTADDYSKLLTDQAGVCKICNRPPGKRRLAVDHCHKTGVVRGLLCTHCNLALPLLERYLSDEAVKKAADSYLSASIETVK